MQAATSEEMSFSDKWYCGIVLKSVDMLQFWLNGTLYTNAYVRFYTHLELKLLNIPWSENCLKQNSKKKKAHNLWWPTQFSRKSYRLPWQLNKSSLKDQGRYVLKCPRSNHCCITHVKLRSIRPHDMVVCQYTRDPQGPKQKFMACFIFLRFTLPSTVDKAVSKNQGWFIQGLKYQINPGCGCHFHHLHSHSRLHKWSSLCA